MQIAIEVTGYKQKQATSRDFLATARLLCKIVSRRPNFIFAS